MLVPLLALTLLAAPEPPTSVHLGVGSQKLIQVAHLQALAVGDPGVADVRVIGGGQILVAGTGQGETDLLVFRDRLPIVRYRLRVHKGTCDYPFSELKRALGDPQDIHFLLLSSRIYLEGTADSEEEWEKLKQVRALYPGIISFVNLSPRVVDQAVRRANDDLQRAGFTQVRAVQAGREVLLEGQVEDRADRLKAEALVAPARALAAELGHL